jgi:SAM-dependent methyltransferase
MAGRPTPFDWGAKPYHFLTGQRHWRASCAALVDPLPARDGLVVLDLGTGPGTSAIAIAAARPGYRVIGLDLSAVMIGRARRGVAAAEVGDRVRLCVGDGAALPFGNGTIDAVTAHSVLYLVEDAPAVLAEVRRVLAPGGRAVFMEPRAGFAGRGILAALRSARFCASMVGWRVMSALKGRYDPAGLEQTFADAGFIVVEVRPNLWDLGLLVVAERPA